MFLVIDNYDSFTYNLVQYLGELSVDHHITKELLVKRNDEITLEEIRHINPDGILLSPGPGNPDQSGICLPILQNLSKEIPILGVCLGHQSIGQSFKGKIVKAKKIMHGKTSNINNLGSKIFNGIPKTFSATRYHSLIIKNKTISNDFKIIATTKDDNHEVIMGIEHKTYPCFGVQFHPESIASHPYGKKIVKNFLMIK